MALKRIQKVSVCFSFRAVIITSWAVVCIWHCPPVKVKAVRRQLGVWGPLGPAFWAPFKISHRQRRANRWCGVWRMATVWMYTSVLLLSILSVSFNYLSVRIWTDCSRWLIYPEVSNSANQASQCNDMLASYGQSRFGLLGWRVRYLPFLHTSLRPRRVRPLACQVAEWQLVAKIEPWRRCCHIWDGNRGTGAVHGVYLYNR